MTKSTAKNPDSEPKCTEVKLRVTERQKRLWTHLAVIYAGGNLSMLIEDAMNRRKPRILVPSDYVRPRKVKSQ